MVGTKGGGTLRMSRSSQLTFLKKACFFTSSASRSVAPRRRSGFLRNSWKAKRKSWSKRTGTVSLFFQYRFLKVIVGSRNKSSAFELGAKRFWAEHCFGCLNYLLFAWWQWLPGRGSVGSALRRWQSNRRPPPRHPRGTATRPLKVRTPVYTFSPPQQLNPVVNPNPHWRRPVWPTKL